MVFRKSPEHRGFLCLPTVQGLADPFDASRTHSAPPHHSRRTAASPQATPAHPCRARGAADALSAFLAPGAAGDWAAGAEAVAERLRAMAASEQMLRTLPEADERRAAVDELREELGLALEPRRLEAEQRAAVVLPAISELIELVALGESDQTAQCGIFDVDTVGRRVSGGVP